MPATVSGKVYGDSNHNGQYDPSEPGISGVYVVLSGPGGCSSAQTNSNGEFTYLISEPGNYVLYEPVTAPASCPPSVFAQPAGYTLSNSPRKRSFLITAQQIAGNADIDNQDFSHDDRFSPLGCTTDLIHFVASPTEWYNTNLTTGQSVLQNTLIPQDTVTAVAFHPDDSYLYGYDQTAGSLARIDSAGQITILTGVSGLPAGPYSAAAIDNQGFLYLYNTGNASFYTVDLRPDSSTYLLLVDPANGYQQQAGPYGTALSVPVSIGDWAAHGDFLYGVQRDGAVVRINPKNGSVTPLATSGPNPGSTFGAVVMDSNGILYAINNNDGSIYRYILQDSSAAGTRFSTTRPQSVQNAALCPSASIEVDFGDAPDAGSSGGAGNYHTLLASNGPRHGLINTLFLGVQATGELDALQNSTATGDDIPRNIQDDGVYTPLPSLSTSATSYSLNVSVTNQTGRTANLYGWIDFNKNGFFEANESATQTIPSASGIQTATLQFTVPAGVSLQPDHTFVRLRITTDNLDIGSSSIEDERSVGPASDGEVEDYLLEIGTEASLSIQKTADLSILNNGDTITYTIAVTNNGSDSALDVQIRDAIPAEIANPEYRINAGGAWAPWTGALSVGTLAPSATYTLEIRGTFQGSSENAVTNTAAASSSTQQVTSTVVTPVNASANLRIQKTSEQSSIVAGEVLTYKIEVTNQGPDTAHNIIVTDIHPAEMEQIQYSLDEGVQWIPWTDQLTDIELAPQNSFSFLLRGRIMSSAFGSVLNTAQVTSSTPDPSPEDNESYVETPVISPVNLSIQKTASPNPVPQGELLTYTITVFNNGPVDADDVAIQDTVPADLLNPEYSIDGGNTWLPWQGSYQHGTLFEYASIVLLIRGKVSDTATGSLSNTAVVTSSTPDPNPEDNSSTIETAVQPSADLSIRKTASPDPVTAGKTLTYDLTVANAGPSAASQVTVTDAIPSFLLNPEFSIDNGTSWNPWVSPYSLGDLANQVSRTLLIRGTVQVLEDQTLSNTASVSSSTPDPNPDNNSSTVVVRAEASADLSISKSAAPSPIKAGETITYTIKIENAGPSRSQEITLTDTGASSLIGAQVSDNGGTSWSSWNGSYSLTSLNPGSSFTVLIRGTVPPSFSENLENTAVISSYTNDPNPDNNSVTVNTPVESSADLSVIKSASPNPAQLGRPLTYTVTVANAGPSDAQNVFLVDTPSTSLEQVEFSTDGGNTFRPWKNPYSLGTIESGSSISLLIRGILSSSTSSPIANTATVSSSTPDPDPSNNTIHLETAVVGSADLSVSKTASPNPAVVGQPLLYTVAVKNLGPDSASAVLLTDAITTGLSQPEFSLDGGTSWSPWASPYSLGTLENQAEHTILIRGTVSPSAERNLSNTAAVSSATPDPNPNNNTSTVETDVQSSADLSIRKLASPDPVTIGETLSYSLTISNLGPSSASQVSLSDTLPSSLLNPEFSTDGGVSWKPWVTPYQLGDLPSSGILTVLIRGTVSSSAGQNISNTATVSSSTPDPNPNNNSSSVTVAREASADLSISKTVSPNPVLPGQLVTYTIVVKNLGPDGASTVQISDIIPSQVSEPEFSLDNGASWNPWVSPYSLGTLASQAQRTILIRGTVVSSVEDPFVNSARVNSQTPDPNPGNNMSSVTAEISQQSNLSISKTAWPDPAVPGQMMIYTITVTNPGPSSVGSIVLSDQVSNLLSQVEYTVNRGQSWSPWSGSLSLGSLAAGSSQTIFLRGRLSPNASGDILNTAQISSSSPPSDPEDSKVTVVTPVLPSADLSVIKTASPTPAVPGQPLTYTLTVSNAGPDAARDVILSDAVTNGEYSLDQGKNWYPWNGSYPLGEIAAGQSASLLLRVSVEYFDSAPIVNTVLVSADTYDPNSENNRFTIAIPKVPYAQLSVCKCACQGVATPGQYLSYSITISNDGPGDAQNVVLTDQIPSELKNVQYSTDGGATWLPWDSSYSLGTLSANTCVTIWISGLVNAFSSGNIINTAIISSSTPDPNGTSHSSTAVTCICPPRGWNQCSPYEKNFYNH